MGEVGGRVKYPETDTSSSKSSGQVMKETKIDAQIFVAVGKAVKESKSTLIWALQKQKSKGKKICLIHVHQLAQFIPMTSNHCYFGYYS